jgi:hypothetical protein
LFWTANSNSNNSACYVAFLIVQFLGQVNTTIIPISEQVVGFNNRHTQSQAVHHRKNCSWSEGFLQVWQITLFACKFSIIRNYTVNITSDNVR